MRLAEISALKKHYPDAKTRARTMPAPDALSDPERKALFWYREHGYAPINAGLRGVPPEWAMPAPAEQEAQYGIALSPEQGVHHIDAAMAKAPKRARPITVYRGEKNPAQAKKLAALAPGDSFVDPAYLSTSLDPSYAFYAFSSAYDSDLLLMIHVPRSVRGLYIGDLDGQNDHTETEFLIDRDTRYTVRGVRTIPNKNRGHPITSVRLVMLSAAPGRRAP